jgi:uncharacterized protein
VAVDISDAYRPVARILLEDAPLFLAEVEDRLSERERWLIESERRIRRTPEPPLIPVDVAKVGRNDPCPCGSGLKYKRCHGSWS